MEFAGVHTALVTAFRPGGAQLDEAALRALVERQVEAKVAGIVVAGTTGESPTLSFEEHLRVIELCLHQAAGRVPIMAGCGSNATSEAIALTKEATALGVASILSVTPYYNRPSQRGLLAHFRAIADCTHLPIVLYDVPGRTGSKLESQSVVELAENCPNVLAYKVATGDVQDVRALSQARRTGQLKESFALLSGDDALTREFMDEGACGVVSVSSNAYPEQMVAYVQALTDGDRQQALRLEAQLEPLFANLLSLDSNPVPIKALLGALGLCSADLRLPLVGLDAAGQATMEQIILEMGAR